MRLFLAPGDLACDMANLPKDSDHRMIFRSFINMLFYGAVGSAIILWVMV
jgi:hypothetical protein